MGSTAASRIEVAISSTEYDLALARDLAERLLGRLSSGGRGAVYIGATADASPARARAATNAWSKSRIVIVLHDRLWGKTPATSAAAETLAVRKKTSPKSIKVVRLDDTALPSSLRGADAKPINQGLESVIEWLTTALATAGGPVKKPKAPSKTKAAPIISEVDKRAEVAA